MQPLIFPSYIFHIQEIEDKKVVWDVCRKKWVQLTPEEWVRQHLVHFLIYEKGILLTSISIEREIKYLKRKKRFDVVVFDNQAKPLIICECKAPHIAITQETALQIATYNTVLKAPFLLITNGLDLFFLKKQADNSYENIVFL